MTNNTALQVINFNFYGDDLIALKDNVTGEIYTSINSVLRGIGFKDEQVRYQRGKWIKDKSISKGVLKFNIPSNGGNQLTECISTHKLPLALAKINITRRLERDYPNITDKLELYQDKCADVLASVFIEYKTTDQITMQPILDTLNAFAKTVNDTLLSLNERMNKLEENQTHVQKALPKKRFSYWQSKMFPKYQLLMDYFGIDKNGDLYKQLYKEFHNMYPSIEINQIVDDYCYENKLDGCFTLDAIEHDKDVRKLFEAMVDTLLEKYELLSENVNIREKTIFDD